MQLTNHVLSEGELIQTPTEDIAVAERSWLRLWDHFMRHNELEKAASMPIPWDLYTRMKVMGYSHQSMMAFDKVNAEIRREAILKARSNFIENAYTPADLESRFRDSKTNEVIQFIMGHVIADNPNSVLECETPFGELTAEMAKLDIPITAFMPCESTSSHLKTLINDQTLPVKIIHDVFEGHNLDDAEFDTVVVRDLFLYTPNDRALLKCVHGLAKKSVIITCVEGSLGRGFLTENSIHKNILAAQRRCFTQEILEEMVLQTLDDPKFEVEIRTYLDQRHICMYLER